ncbi:hypothetical protein NL676_024789 [Syzygium grande]|nr:hypothetical protein NL676_024789 [Syzygium grande]
MNPIHADPSRNEHSSRTNADGQKLDFFHGHRNLEGKKWEAAFVQVHREWWVINPEDACGSGPRIFSPGSRIVFLLLSPIICLHEMTDGGRRDGAVFRARIVDGRADRGAIVHPSVKFVSLSPSILSGQMTSEGEGMDEGDGKCGRS